MGKYSLQFIPLPNLGFHLVFFLDASDIPDLLQVSHRLIRVVSTHSRILSGIYKDTEKFATFDSHFFKILAENKRFFIISVHEVDQGTFFEEFLRLLPEVLKAEKETLLKERSSLEFRLRSPLNFVEKRNILLQLQKICQPLKDRNGIQNYTQQLKGLIKEIDDTKFRVIFLLKQAKEAINTSIEHAPYKSIADIDLREAYLKLYSFSQKLHFLGRNDLAEEYNQIAQLLLDKPESRLHDLSGLISQILNLSENIESYLKEEKK